MNVNPSNVLQSEPHFGHYSPFNSHIFGFFLQKGTFDIVSVDSLIVKETYDYM